MDTSKTKIAIISHSLGSGGAERFAGELSFMLEHIGYEVHLIIVNDIVDYPYAGKLYNLGFLCENDWGLIKKIKKGLLLKKYLDLENIQLIIDNRTRNQFSREWCTKRLYGKRKTYFIIHSFNIKNYLPATVFLAKKLYGRAAKIICVSKEIEEQVIQKYGFTNTTTIYNPARYVDSEWILNLNLPKKYILFFGRLDEKVKNFTLLLDAFSHSEIFVDGFHLIIMGDGKSKDYIKSAIESLGISNYVTLVPFQKNPFIYVKNAWFTILTSRYEGFPMSIIESLSLGTPVISVDCKSGPKEIIQNEQNGLLVENHNIEALADAMSRLTKDQVLYEYIKSNTIQSVAHLSPESIAKEWAKILE
jgi:glycosyltransferase involved in cell wall biosynthesis